MYTVQLNIDDSVFDQFMEAVNKLPKDKFELISEKKDLNAFHEKNETNTFSQENDLNDLLKANNLSHFRFFKDPDRILFNKKTGNARCIDDYKRLVDLLEKHNIKHNDIGIDVLFIED